MVYRKPEVMRNFFSGDSYDATVVAQRKRDSFSTGTNPPYSYVLGAKGGLLSSTTTINGEGELTPGSLAMGRAIASSLTGSGEITTPNLSLVVSMASAITALGIISGASMVGSISMAATIAGSGSITSSLSLISSIVADLIGSGTVTGNLKGTASMEADIFVNQSEATTQELAAAVWNALAAQFNAPGTMGEAMGAAGSAGDPWITNLPGGYGAGSAGYILGNLLASIPDSVWDELKTAHTTTDSYGKIVQDTETQIKKLKTLLLALS
jgi:hypothetical protein